MKVDDLNEYVEHFRYRVMADALQEATANYWRRRARTFRDALPRPDDFTGQASPEEIEAQRMRVAAAILACSQRATVMIGGEIE